MATISVDISNLRSITGGDKDLESRLFDLFIQNSNECLSGMKKLLKDNKKSNQEDERNWNRYAHSLKGLALNVGASFLANLCLKAEKSFSQTDYDDILKEYNKVKKELKALL